MRLEDDVLYLMSLVLHRYFDGMAAEFHRRRLGRSEWRCLAVLAEQDGRNVGELAELTQQPQTTISRVIMRMENNGWVRRSQRQDNARFVEVHISARGRDKLAEILPIVRAHHDDALAGLTRAEQQALRAQLRTMLGNLGADEFGLPRPRTSARRVRRR
ncbi:MAG: MarR family winged helix-turn-helix transcriptional regulator [Dehalococcoidia bacterium]